MNAGHRTWIIPGGHIPLRSTGIEPAFTSRDEICLFNAGRSPVEIRILVYYSDKPPVGPFLLKLDAETVRHIRFNDLVDPAPILLDTDFAALVQASGPVMVQFTRMDTSQANLAAFTTLPYGEDNEP